MVYVKKPNLEITADELCQTQYLKDYLYLKLEQLAIPYTEFSERLGYRSTTMLTNILSGSVEYGIRWESMGEVLALFREYHDKLDLPEMSEAEVAHFRALNGALRQPIPNVAQEKGVAKIKPNSNIGRERLLSTKTLAGFIEAKRLQVGATQKDISEVIGTKYKPSRFRRRTIPLSKDEFNALTSFFEAKSQEIGTATPFNKVEREHFTGMYKIIARKHLLDTRTLAGFINAKCRQLGIDAEEVTRTIGEEYSTKTFRNRGKPLPFEAFNALADLFEDASKAIESATSFDDIERDHFTKLNSRENFLRSGNHSQKTPETQALSEAHDMGVVHSIDISMSF